MLYKRLHYRTTLTAVSLTLNFGLLATAESYTNPVLAGDYPDPSVIRVGQEYWATATSSEWGPPFPILRSRDLVNWEVVGSVFEDRPAWSVANYWAPEIQSWRGRYYVYYVARKQGGPLTVAVASADRPEGPYEDHGPIISQAAGSIDAVACDDENGQRYLIWKEDGNSRRLPTILWAARLDDEGIKLITEPKAILRNDASWEGAVIEGPFPVRRDGWFYLFYSGSGCCGAGCSYALGVARSRTLLGPYEKYARNPILAGNQQWRCPGHGSIVQDAQGRDWLMYHAYAARDFVFTGRQALLDEVKWNADGWPTINAAAGPSAQAPSPLGTPEKNAELSYQDEFDSGKLRPGWNWPIAHRPNYRLADGQLMLTPGASQTNDFLGAVLGRSMTTGDFTANTVLNTATLAPGVWVGLAAVGDLANATGIAATEGAIRVWHRTKGKHQVLTENKVTLSQSLHLRLKAAEGRRYRFAFSTDGQTWTEPGPVASGKDLPPWDRAVRVALTVGGTPKAEARIERFGVEPAF